MDEDLDNAIAIIGMSGRFPGAKNIEEFWNNLCAGVEAISTFSAEALKNANVSEQLINTPNYVRSRGVLNEIELFDAAFFEFSNKEAQITDPQHRIFLECAWEALENAGYCSENYSGSIGVYGGSGTSSYYLNNIYPNRELKEKVGDFLLHISNDKDFLATKVSYKLNLKGPSIAIQSACSTSLVAVCTACNHLLTYQCDMALAGGVSISVPQTMGYLYQEGMILSPDGKCRPFDANAQGTVMANGAGVVILKRLQDAVADKDHIFAVIRGFAINNDGSRKVGFSAPSVEGQAEAIASAIAMAGVDPESISYAEAHGTGTILGDAVEIKGLTQAFCSKERGYCALGSVKSNIGHTAEAAGVIGLIKAVLTLHHQAIPPLASFKQPNPHINFAETPFYINTALKKWERDKNPRRACVSSFGIGGTNAFAILEEWPKRVSPESLPSTYPLILSAKTLTALTNMAHHLGEYLRRHPEFALGDVAYTLKVGRKPFEHRRIVICRDREEAISLLLAFDPHNDLHTMEYPLEDLFKNQEFHRIPLPTYFFEKNRYWIEPPKAQEVAIPLEDHSDSTENILISIWKDCFGVDSINVHDDFFRLGGDSLLASQMVARLCKQFDISLSIQTLFAYPTISKLAKIIFNQKFSASSPLIQLKAGSSKEPLFLIHPIEGILFCYKGLIDTLTCQNPVYGIQSVGLPAKSIEEISARYIEELQKIQPTGPYHLLGMSFGGIIAYEMARVLKAKGESIGLLCMIDVSKPDPKLLPLGNDSAMLTCLVELMEGKPVLEQEVSFEKVIQCLGLTLFSFEDQQVIFKHLQAHLRALSSYQLKPYEGKILFFQAKERFFRLKDIGLGSSWEDLVNGGVEIQEIAGNHANILRQPQVAILAKRLEAHLCQRTNV